MQLRKIFLPQVSDLVWGREASVELGHKIAVGPKNLSCFSVASQFLKIPMLFRRRRVFRNGNPSCLNFLHISS